jgi:hypothetical protein
MITAAIRRLGLLFILGVGMWLVGKVRAEQVDRRRLSVSTAPWPDVPLDPDPMAASEATRVDLIAERVSPQGVSALHSGAVVTLQLPLEANRGPELLSGPELSPAQASTWLPPIDGKCPPTHPVKAKLRSHLYHLPGMLAYGRTIPDHCYTDAAAAERDGFVRSRR